MNKAKFVFACSILVFAFLSEAGIGRRKNLWKINSVVRVEVRGAQEQELHCLASVVSQYEAVVPIEFAFFRSGSGPKKRDVVLNIKRGGNGIIGGHSAVGNSLGIEHMEIVFPTNQQSAGCGPSLRHTILHEFGHLMGLEHEHQNPKAPQEVSRQIRQDHAQLGARNIGRLANNARKYVITEYDTCSVMHYLMTLTPEVIASISGNICRQARVPFTQPALELSSGDVATLEEMYL